MLERRKKGENWRVLNFENWEYAVAGNNITDHAIVQHLFRETDIVGLLYKISFTVDHRQRHLLRDRRPSTTACQACWAMGTNEWNSLCQGKKYNALGRQQQPRQDKNLFYTHDKPNELTNQGRAPFSFVLFEVPIYLSFDGQQGPPLSSLSAPRMVGKSDRF